MLPLFSSLAAQLLHSLLPTKLFPLWPASHFDVYDLANNQGADKLGNQGINAHLDALVGCPQFFDVVVFDVHHQQEQTKRQGDQDHTGKSTFRSKGLDLPKDAESLPNDVANLVENLRQVAARLPLNEHRRYKKT